MYEVYYSERTGKKGSAFEYSRYISRSGRHAERNDLVAAGSGNLPEWAAGKPEKFWKSGDAFERKNGAVFREVVISLPNELDTKDQAAVIADYCEQNFKSKTFQWAMHAPPARAQACLQPHAHVMVSDRLLDEHSRSPRQHFSRFNPAHPESGGCKKDSGAGSISSFRGQILERRKAMVELQGEALAIASRKGEAPENAGENSAPERWNQAAAPHEFHVLEG